MGEKIKFMKLKNKFIVIIPLYNAKHLIETCLMSILNQTYSDIGIIIRDDISNDGTESVVKNLFSNSEDVFKTQFMGKDIIYVRNNIKFYPLGNTYDSVMNYVDNRESIIGVVDGDDSLISTDAICKIMEIYDKYPDKWLVWSQHKNSTGEIGQSKPLPSDEQIYSNRDYWAVTHFRTSKAGLYYKLKRSHLMDPFVENSFYTYSGDAAFLFPFIEMCGNEHSYYLDEVLYHYNIDLPTNEHNKNLDNALKYGKYIRKKGRRYRKLKSLDIIEKKRFKNAIREIVKLLKSLIITFTRNPD